MRYGLELWGNSSKVVDIFKLQKKVVRVICGAGYRDHCKPYFIDLKILTLPCLHIYLQLCEAHRNKQTFRENSDFHRYPTSSASLLRLPRYRLEVSRRNSLNLLLYNILPIDIKSLPLKRFKGSVKTFFAENAFYSVGEYTRALGGDGVP